MASLLELLFETMPLAGARYSARMDAGSAPDIPDFRDVPASLVKDYAAALSAAELFLVSNDNTHTADQLKKIPRMSQPIWSYDASTDLHSVRNLDCRSEQEAYAKCRVLESLSFGGDFESGFTNSIEVTLQSGAKRLLPLNGDSLLATFKTSNGWSYEGDGSFWPARGAHDQGFVHVFLFDVSLVTGEVSPASAVHDPELDKFRSQVRKLREEEQTSEKMGALFVDDAWQVLPTMQAVVAEVLDAALQNSVLWRDTKVVATVPHRIVVCTMLTMHKAYDDFTPGPTAPAWGARFYPVIMVNTTHPLKAIRGGLRQVRPASTTIDGKANAPCHCSEMNTSIGSLLVSDSNTAVAPFNAWNHLFEYYVPKAAGEPWAKSWTRVVAHDWTRRRTITGALERFGDNGDITRVARQGAFDNIHMAPTMRMPKITKIRSGTISGMILHTHELAEADRGGWHFDDVAMAPICAHDCFHFHWRWGERIVGASQSISHGWANGRPYQVQGAPLVRENQDVYIRLPDARTIDYQAHIFAIAAGDWQIINHHGADYVLETTSAVDAARTAQDAGGGDLKLGDYLYEFLDESKLFAPRTAAEFWAVFYWRNRYYIETNVWTGIPVAWKPRERTIIQDMTKVRLEIAGRK